MNWHKSGCVCGPHKSTATVSRSLSFYIARDVPTGEIDQIIGWLDSIREDCEFKISQLESLKRDRERARTWRRDLNRLANEFLDPDSLHLDIDTRTQIIRQRLGCDPKRARDIAALVDAKAARMRRKDRDAEIAHMAAAGIPAAKIAAKYDLSRQQVYNIIKNRRETRYFGP